ncbi:MAG TPA: zinc-finger domain-containing protein [Burkholderiales bacterium]|jgi:uncharacterized Zn-finger protein|nr:zinc-finger domain-containing protein [Burkholderiales bacterium]
MADAQNQETVVVVTEKDLPLHCPTPNTPVWSLHPRVFLEVADLGTVRCPYCGTVYEYKGKPPTGH